MHDDFDLLARWQGGDAAAGSTLFRRHVRALFLFFSNKVFAPADVEDLVQSTLLRCVGAKDRIWAGASFSAFALGVARKVLFGYFESRRRDARFEPLLWSVQDVGRHPVELLAVSEEHRMLLRALGTIPVDFQITVELVYWHGLRTADVAHVLGIAEATVRTRVARARTLLNQALGRMASGKDATMRDLVAVSRGFEVGHRTQAPAPSGSKSRP